MAAPYTVPAVHNLLPLYTTTESVWRWRNLANTLDIYLYLLERGTHVGILLMPHATGPVENMMSSTKPEVHNVFHCRQGGGQIHGPGQLVSYLVKEFTLT